MTLKLPKKLLSMLLDIADELYDPSIKMNAKSFGESVTALTRSKIHKNIFELVRLYKKDNENNFLNILKARIQLQIRIHKAQLRKLNARSMCIDSTNFIYFDNLSKLINMIK